MQDFLTGAWRDVTGLFGGVGGGGVTATAAPSGGYAAGLGADGLGTIGSASGLGFFGGGAGASGGGLAGLGAVAWPAAIAAAIGFGKNTEANHANTPLATFCSEPSHRRPRRSSRTRLAWDCPRSLGFRSSRPSPPPRKRRRRSRNGHRSSRVSERCPSGHVRRPGDVAWTSTPATGTKTITPTPRRPRRCPRGHGAERREQRPAGSSGRREALGGIGDRPRSRAAPARPTRSPTAWRPAPWSTA